MVDYPPAVFPLVDYPLAVFHPTVKEAISSTASLYGHSSVFFGIVMVSTIWLSVSLRSETARMPLL